MPRIPPLSLNHPVLSEFLLAVSASLSLFAFLSGEIRLWSLSGPVISPAFRYSLFLPLGIASVGLALCHFRMRSLPLSPSGWAAPIVLLFLSDWLCRSYNLLQGPSIRGPILLGTALGALIIWRGALKAWPLFLLFSIALLLWCFFTEANGRLLFADDHPVQLFRLALLKENFPHIPFYSPLWNGGFDARDFFATGILNMFLLFSPAIYAFDIFESYNLLVAASLFVVTPLATLFAARTLGLQSPTPWIAATLSLTSSLLWYRWSLKYGTTGFVICTALLPLCLALCIRFLERELAWSLKHTLSLALALTLMLLWPLGGVFFLPIFGLFTVRLGYFFRRPYAKTLLCGILILNVPWMILFLHTSQVGRFLALKTPTVEVTATPSGGERKKVTEHSGSSRVVRAALRSLEPESLVHHIREVSGKIHPLILFLFLPGIPLLPLRTARLSYLLLAIWLTSLGVFVGPLVPQIELDRALIALSVLAILPASLAFTRLVQGEWHERFLAILCSGFLFAGPFAAANFLHNRSWERFTFATSQVNELAEHVARYGGEGRTLFPGFILHHLNDGHISPLALMSGKPMVASSPFHNVWWHTELIPPERVAGGAALVEPFFDLFNATALVTHGRRWNRYCERHADTYQKVWEEGGFALFTRSPQVPGYFLEGAGDLLTQEANLIVAQLRTPDAVLKFRHFSFLISDNCSITPVEVDPGISFIRLSGCDTSRPVAIRGQTGFNRIF